MNRFFEFGFFGDQQSGALVGFGLGIGHQLAEVIPFFQPLKRHFLVTCFTQSHFEPLVLDLWPRVGGHRCVQSSINNVTLTQTSVNKPISQPAAFVKCKFENLFINKAKRFQFNHSLLNELFVKQCSLIKPNGWIKKKLVNELISRLPLSRVRRCDPCSLWRSCRSSCSCLRLLLICVRRPITDSPSPLTKPSIKIKLVNRPEPPVQLM